MTRLTKEEKLAKLEADLAHHKRKLRMETVPGVKEAVFLAKALRKWNDEHGDIVLDENDCVASAAEILDSCAEEPQ